MTEDEKPTTEDEKPTTEDEKPTTEDEKPTTEDEKPVPSRGRVLAYVGVNILGLALIIIGISLIFWIGRPYMTLYLSSSTKQAYQAKADGPAPKDNRIIIPGVLVNAPILEGFTEENLEGAVAHVVDSAVPAEKGNVILAGHNYAYFVQGDQNLFSLLHLLNKEMTIYLFWEGKRYTYHMVNKKTVERDDPSIFVPTSYPALTLIASASSWDAATISSTRRLIIRALPAKK